MTTYCVIYVIVTNIYANSAGFSSNPKDHQLVIQSSMSPHTIDHHNYLCMESPHNLRAPKPTTHSPHYVPPRLRCNMHLKRNEMPNRKITSNRILFEWCEEGATNKNHRPLWWTSKPPPPTQSVYAYIVLVVMRDGLRR